MAFFPPAMYLYILSLPLHSHCMCSSAESGVAWSGRPAGQACPEPLVEPSPRAALEHLSLRVFQRGDICHWHVFSAVMYLYVLSLPLHSDCMRSLAESGVVLSGRPAGKACPEPLVEPSPRTIVKHLSSRALQCEDTCHWHVFLQLCIFMF